MSNEKTNKHSSAIGFSISLVCIVLASLLFLNRQQVVDQFAVWSYTPTERIATISSRAELTGRGEFLFHATHPGVEPAESFNDKCPRQEQASPILGCYTADDRIYIFDITDARLDGMPEVTAVHEVLHAAWQRLRVGERESLAAELKAAYEKHKTPELEKRMAYYERAEPEEIVNELHSILGTEVPNLGTSLEAYYAKLFNRKAVLALHSGYSATYNGLYAKAESLFATIESMAKDIGVRSEQYAVDAQGYSRDVNSFNSRAEGGSFTSQAQFNAERSVLVRRLDALDATRQKINEDIEKYNQMNDEYKDIASQIEGLNRSVDSIKQLEQAPSV